jgi:hypothetical protein
MCNQVAACVLVIILAAVTSSTYAVPQTVSLSTTSNRPILAFTQLWYIQITKAEFRKEVYVELFCLLKQIKYIAIMKHSTLLLISLLQS